MCYNYLVMKDIWQRLSIMIGEDNVKMLNRKRVILFGVGGVGGYVAEMLIRSGIEQLSIVDFDTVDISNINRQVVALQSTIGKMKVDVMKERLLDINPHAKIWEYKLRLDSSTIDKFDLQSYDFVIDCIDDVTAKQLLIKYCKEFNLNFIVSCGAGNRFSDVPKFEIDDVSKTSYDRLAKVIRKFCQQEGLKNVPVVYTKQQPIKCAGNVVGSIAYYPSSMASAISAYVINKFLEK